MRDATALPSAVAVLGGLALARRSLKPWLLGRRCQRQRANSNSGAGGMSRRPDCSIVIKRQALERGREWIEYQEPNVCLSREVKQIDQVFVEAEGKLLLSKSC